jgi:aspartyl-tRNA(Asn)/glutamyl-tRNA(Gln) amidotransferase subunit C
MKISKKQVEDVAFLARLTLSDEELDKMTIQLGEILSYVEKLNELDTSTIKPTSHVFSVSNAFREDKVKISLTQNEALMNAPKQHEDMFQVPKILL